MFDNLIGQDEFRALVEGDLRGGSLPHSLLFAGPPASGKLTAALELARVLSCQGGERGAWNCPCGSCSRHRALVHPDLLLFGRRSFPEEIPAAHDSLARSPSKAGAYFFIRAARKLTKRFDPPLWEGEEAKLAKAAPFVAEIEELLGALDPLTSGQADAKAQEAAAKAAADLLPVARKLESLVPDMPPVAMVRSAEFWGRLAPSGSRKTIVIENADAMNDSARNALLKILEEPPEALGFVLLSAKRSGMMKTILSRVRTYQFAERDAASSGLVLEKVFRSPDLARLEGSGPANLSIASWLASRRPYPPEAARGHARALLAAVLAEREAAGAGLGPALLEAAEAGRAGGLGMAKALSLVAAETKDFGAKDDSYAQAWQALLASLGDALGELLRLPGLAAVDLDWISPATEAVRRASARREGYNLSPGLLLEALLYELRDLARGSLPGRVAGAR